MTVEYGRNDRCPCGSRRKAKHCHLAPNGPPEGVPVIVGGAVTQAPGEPWDGRRGGVELLAYLDAGAGDAIHAMRHVRHVESLARVWWVVRPSMESLFRKSFPESRVTSVHPVPTTVPFRTTTFGLIEMGADRKWPAPSAPYLHISATDRPDWGGPHWPRPLRDGRDNLSGAFCPRGDSTQAFDRWRSILDDKAALPLRMDGVRWHDTSMRTFEDWLDTACFVIWHDLVVSVDTEMAHLAGALGVPLILLDRAAGPGDPGPDDRWDEGYLQKGNLYPGAFRRFRQTTRGDWTGPVAAARDEIAALLR